MGQFEEDIFDYITIVSLSLHFNRKALALLWAKPAYMLHSVTEADWQGLPSPETMQAVEGYTLLRTDRIGWIELTPDGE